MASQEIDHAQTEGLIGAAVVVGAGIAGMQAALDLAEPGIKVYLIDSAPAIGGKMAMLDKTFPTNDCAMCIMSPKLVEVGRHRNIELMTNTTLESVSGEPGNFTVRVNQHPRYVDISKCTGCGDCTTVCPINLPDVFNACLSERKAIYKLYPQAIPNAYAIEKRGIAPCREACPIHQRAQGYIALVSERRFADAYLTILEENPFPSICGRVCNHRCEDACNRGQVDAPVNIMALKRFVSDWAFENPDLVEPAQKINARQEFNGKRVAVVGAGPAGLTCAQDLTRQGYQVTVYEALPLAGGMMRVGIPSHRLPREIVEREIDRILAQGVELKLNHRIENAETLLETYDAVFVAIGAHQGVKLPIPGNELPGVLMATEFLRQVSLKSDYEYGEPDSNVAKMIQGKRVLVLGGGNVAIDTAMTAVRLGASWVGVTCLEGRQQMPAHAWEVSDAEEEGVEVFPSRTFKAITSNGKSIVGVHTAHVDFRGFFDGRPDFDEIPGTEEIIPTEVVIFAIGQRPESGCLNEITRTGGDWVSVNPATLATDVPGIFAGGDVVTGTSFIVDAIAAGHRAARSIKAYLNEVQAAKETDLPVAKLTQEEVRQCLQSQTVSPVSRCELPKRPALERVSDFLEVYEGLTEEQALNEAARCLRCGVCSECNQCVYVCRANAIIQHDAERILDLHVGAVILTPGLEPVWGNIRPEYGYGRYVNVVTSIQFERMLSASGPFLGVLQRPSDGTLPRKIAWIQCVGSRDYSESPHTVQNKLLERAPYCSTVCCMYSTKEAIIAKEHDPAIEATIFYMDIRSFGKGFEQYIERAKVEHGIRYVRCMVSMVKEVPGSQNLRLGYVAYEGENGKYPVLHEEEFDLVILSVGLRPSAEALAMAERVNVKLNDYGFAYTDPYNPSQTSREGIFVAGAFAEPKDIPESVVEASCAAAQVSALLYNVRGTLTRTPDYPPERDISGELPRIGVFICHCGINIGSVVKVPEVVEDTKLLPGVVYAEHNLYTCSQDTQERIVQEIQQHNLNRIVVASCTPRSHEPLFQDTLRQAGLNPHLFEMANIREHDSWVHRAVPDAATAKAKELVAMSVAKARKLVPIYRNTFNVDRSALVIGGGVAGMTAALAIAQQGFDVYLIERDVTLGGNLRHIHIGTFRDEDPQQLLVRTIEAVYLEPRITVLTETQLLYIDGYTGRYRTQVKKADRSELELHHGVIVVSTGAQGITPSEYFYGKHPNVITQREFEARLVNPQSQLQNLQTIVMIQCVGSREEKHLYCSRVCCTQALKNALAIKERVPAVNVVVLYRDLRTYGFRESLYRQARESGVLFLEYDVNKKPQIMQKGNEQLLITVSAQPEGEVITLAADWLVLSTGVEPEPGNAALAQQLKIPLNADGFFLEAHVKLAPVDFAAKGIFLAGMAHSPRSIAESITQAKAAAVRAVALLAKPQLEATPIVASVNPKLCTACGICVDTCPYGARILEPGVGHAEVLEVLCQGCGACVAACPNKASQQKGYEFAHVFSMLEEVLI